MIVNEAVLTKFRKELRDLGHSEAEIKKIIKEQLAFSQDLIDNPEKFRKMMDIAEEAMKKGLCITMGPEDRGVFKPRSFGLILDDESKL